MSKSVVIYFKTMSPQGKQNFLFRNSTVSRLPHRDIVVLKKKRRKLVCPHRFLRRQIYGFLKQVSTLCLEVSSSSPRNTP